MQIGDVVKVLAPFDGVFPDTYIIEGFESARNAFVICGDREFEEQFLEVVDGNNNP